MKRVKIHNVKKGFGSVSSMVLMQALNPLPNRYIQSLQFLMRNKWIAITGLVVITAASFWMVKKTPTGFIPTEDQGFVLYAVNTPPGSSLDRTHQATEAIDSIVQKEPCDRSSVCCGRIELHQLFQCLSLCCRLYQAERL